MWGSRGSLAAPGAETVRYGGNTSCIEVRSDAGDVLVFDAGTGMRELGNRLVDEGVRCVHLFLSHLHLDHLQGLAFFAPLYQPGVEVMIWGPPSPTKSLEARIAAYMSEPLFPVNLSEVPSNTSFHDAPVDGVKVGELTVFAQAVSHKGPTVGYRIENGTRSLAYVPDHEPSLGTDLDTAEATWISGFALCEDVDVLLHDAQYTEDEYPAHEGWGHSSIEHVVTLARRARVDQLVLFHHDPRHSDDDLDRVAGRAGELWGADGKPPILAFDGMVIEL